MNIDLKNMQVNFNQVYWFEFSKREKEVLECLIKGNIVKEVAVILNIAFTTADTHIKNAKKKTGAKNMAQLIALFIGSKN